MPKVPKTPTASEEALQEPTIDPLFLLASMMTGGITGGPKAYGQAARQIPEILEGLSQRGVSVPWMFAKNAMKSATQQGANFTGLAALNSILDPKHPTLNNALALPVMPGMNALKGYLPKAAGRTAKNVLSTGFPELDDILLRLRPLFMIPSLLQKDKKKK